MASNYVNYAAAVLKGIHAPVTPGNIAGFIGWSEAEGPLGSSNWQRNNPLNTTESSGSTSTFNSAGVKGYPNFNTGVAATVKTLLNGFYGGILSAFRSNDPRGLGAAIGSSPWGTSGALASSTIAAALGKNWGMPSGATSNPSPKAPASHNKGSAPANSSSNTLPAIGALTSTITTGGVPDLQGAAAASLLQGASQPINPNGAFHSDNSLTNLLGLADSGAFTTPTQTTSTSYTGLGGPFNLAAGPPSGSGNKQPNKKGGGGSSGGNNSGYANPFTHWTPGRLDKGYDGTFTGPLKSPVNGTILYASRSFSNWGGYVVVRADHKIPGLPSRNFYFAEGLFPTVHAGQRVSAGQQIAVPGTIGAQAGVPGNIEWGIAGEGSTIGSPIDPYSAGASDASAVVAFLHWAEQALGVSSTSDTGNAGSF